MPQLSHPDLDGEITVSESAVRVHERSGWRRVGVEDPTPVSRKRSGSPTSKTAPEAEADKAESTEPQEG